MRRLFFLTFALVLLLAGCATDEELLTSYAKGYESSRVRVEQLEQQVDKLLVWNDALKDVLTDHGLASEIPDEDDLGLTSWSDDTSDDSYEDYDVSYGSYDYDDDSYYYDEDDSYDDEYYDDSSYTYVYITDTGSKYHSYGCQYLAHSCHEITLSAAIARGYEPCSRCDPPR